eukprot:4982337-Pyramimonas_sp.AAC.1
MSQQSFGVKSSGFSETVQKTLDLKLEAQFRNAAGDNNTEDRAAEYGYRDVADISRPTDPTEAKTRPAGFPVTQEELRKYGQRVLRPGIVQPFGVVFLLGMGDTFGVSFGHVLAVSSNVAQVLPRPHDSCNLPQNRASVEPDVETHCARAESSLGELDANPVDRGKVGLSGWQANNSTSTRRVIVRRW